MTPPKIQTLASLEQEMRAVARGESSAPEDAAHASFNSAEALIQHTASETQPHAPHSRGVNGACVDFKAAPCLLYP